MAITIIIFVVGLALVALLSSSEASLISVNKIRVRHRAAEGDKGARAVLDVVNNYEKLFAAVSLTGNVLIILVASLGDRLAIRLLGDLGESVAGLALATAATTLLVVMFGEITPKSLAALAAEKWSLVVARPTRLLMRIESPLLYAFALIPRAITNLLGGREALMTPSVTEGELRMLIDMGEAEGTVESAQGEMLENVFRFGETEVREVMTPRNEIQWIGAGTTLREYLDIYRLHPHSRFPVYEDDLDDVAGILSTKDVVRSLAEGVAQPDEPITRLMRTALFVPETKRLDDLFTIMQQLGHKIVLVVDEFGGIAGLVTLTRALEQIVGRTGEEGTRHKEPFITIDENTYDIDGVMTVDEANDRLGLGIPEGDYETVAGFVLELAQRIPRQGEGFRHGDFRIVVSKMDDNRVVKVRVRRRQRVFESAAP